VGFHSNDSIRAPKSPHNAPKGQVISTKYRIYMGTGRPPFCALLFPPPRCTVIGAGRAQMAACAEPNWLVGHFSTHECATSWHAMAHGEQRTRRSREAKNKPKKTHSEAPARQAATPVRPRRVISGHQSRKAASGFPIAIPFLLVCFKLCRPGEPSGSSYSLRGFAETGECVHSGYASSASF